MEGRPTGVWMCVGMELRNSRSGHRGKPPTYNPEAHSGKKDGLRHPRQHASTEGPLAILIDDQPQVTSSARPSPSRGTSASEQRPGWEQPALKCEVVGAPAKAT